MAVVYVREGMLVELDAILAEASLVVLWTNSGLIPTVTTVFTDLVLATFSGYAPVTPSFGAGGIDSNGNAARTAGVCQFTHNGGGVSNNVYGWALCRYVGGVAKIRHVERFSDAPRVMAASGNTIFITPTKTQGGCP